MKYKLILLVLTLCLFAVAPVVAQWDEEIEGAGKPGHIPMFTGYHKIGNSPIFESNGNIGIGTTTPLFPVHVFSNNTVPPPGHDSPIALFVETPAELTSGQCGSCAIIGIEGLVSAGSSGINVIGVQGVTYSPSGVGVLGNHPVVN
jgi:hypothetical protein